MRGGRKRLPCIAKDVEYAAWHRPVLTTFPFPGEGRSPVAEVLITERCTPLSA